MKGGSLSLRKFLTKDQSGGVRAENSILNRSIDFVFKTQVCFDKDDRKKSFKWLYLVYFQQQSANRQFIDKDPKPENAFKNAGDSKTQEGRDRDQNWDGIRSRATSTKEGLIGQEADSQSNEECGGRTIERGDEGVVDVVDSTCKSEEKQVDTTRLGQQRLFSLSPLQDFEIGKTQPCFCKRHWN